MQKNREKIFEIVRIVKEVYEVRATSREAAANNVENPHTITVVKETIKIKK